MPDGCFDLTENLCGACRIQCRRRGGVWHPGGSRQKITDTLGVPDNIRPVLPVVKAAAAVGLLSVTRFPALARLTTAMLTLYFALAVGAHIRACDKVVNTLPAASFLATFAVMTVKGPDGA